MRVGSKEPTYASVVYGSSSKETNQPLISGGSVALRGGTQDEFAARAGPRMARRPRTSAPPIAVLTDGPAWSPARDGWTRLCGDRVEIRDA